MIEDEYENLLLILNEVSITLTSISLQKQDLESFLGTVGILANI